jgi:hypothetical protein
MKVHETARQVANVPVSANPVPYDQMKSQCEALVMEKQQKMSVLLSFKHSRTDSHGSTGVNGFETNEACISYLQNLDITCIIQISDLCFSPKESSVKILTWPLFLVMCCSHLCGPSMSCNQLGKDACAAAIQHPVILTVRSGCHLQAHTTSSWKRLDGSLVRRLLEAWRFILQVCIQESLPIFQSYSLAPFLTPRSWSLFFHVYIYSPR